MNEATTPHHLASPSVWAKQDFRSPDLPPNCVHHCPQGDQVVCNTGLMPQLPASSVSCWQLWVTEEKSFISSPKMRLISHCLLNAARPQPHFKYSMFGKWPFNLKSISRVSERTQLLNRLFSIALNSATKSVLQMSNVQTATAANADWPLTVLCHGACRLSV